ncbi:MAG TPA: hypothetical protein VFQ54_04580 [Thermomicrobiales bacterium]|nr:hypothetical protein [Thermomicrobiales bacterium]
MTQAILQVAVASSVEEAIRVLIPFMRDEAGTVVLLPSSLDREDRVCAIVAAECPAKVVSPLSAVRWALSSPRSRAIDLDRPDVLVPSVTIPEAVLDASRRFVVCDLDAGDVARSGPFILDLLAHYLSPRDRLRILASGSRGRATAEVNLAVAIDGVIVCGTFGSVHLAVWTEDRIAGELVALALAERKLDVMNRSFTGPWEDAVVQRATELDLGVRIPRDIEIVIAGDGDRSGPAGLLEHIRDRLGITSRPGEWAGL